VHPAPSMPRAHRPRALWPRELRARRVAGAGSHSAALPVHPKQGPQPRVTKRPQRTTRGSTRSKRLPALYRVVWPRTAGVARPRVSTQRPRNTAPTSSDVLRGGTVCSPQLRCKHVLSVRRTRPAPFVGVACTRARASGALGRAAVGWRASCGGLTLRQGAAPLPSVAHSAQLLTRACGRRHASRTTGTVQGGKTVERPRQETESYGLCRPRQPHLQRCARRRVRLQPGSPCPVTACHLFPQPPRATTRSRTRTARRPATRWRQHLLHTTRGSSSTAVAQTSRWKLRSRVVSQDITATLCYRQAPTRTRHGGSNAMTCRRRTSTRRL
jgi:hypothetical protein